MAHRAGGFSLQRMLSYLWRERWNCSATRCAPRLALGGSLLLMFVIGFGISMDVEDLSYAVLDRDQTTLSQNYTLNSGRLALLHRAPAIVDYADLDRRMRSGELSLAIENPPALPRRAAGPERPCRSAPGSTAPCRSAPKPCRATFRACTSTGWRTGSERSGISAWAGGQRRDALSLQPRRQEPARHGAGRDPAAAAHAAGHADRAGGGARERDWARSSICTSRR
jgi:hypothetical protein